MAGRGDNNKHGSAGRGSSNQSNQPFVAQEKNAPASNHSKTKKRGIASVEQEKTMAKEIERDTRWENERIPSHPNTKTFNLLIDEVPYVVKAAPFSYNDELRFYISVNSGIEHVFTWDSEIKRLRAIDDDAGELPDSVEDAISQKLQKEINS